ncbi:MAG TPA: hypothetical protein VK184_13955 [Nostocaceae cyanobacterium]|nr:hypothetical protein [Nostocaceae cyanobacterium]
MNRKIFNAWKSKPPRIYIITQAMADSVEVPLSGGGMASVSADEYELKLKQDLERKTGKYYAYPMGSGECEEETFVLETWEKYTSPDSCYEAMFILYYSALYPYQVIKKHLGEDMAEEYLQETAAFLN